MSVLIDNYLNNKLSVSAFQAETNPPPSDLTASLVIVLRRRRQ
ncbi:hypothetical protein CVH13_00158 [Dehalococcoides mccartyi]|uniref:Uncharacterized protein n=1 Tax=Dehalococcoides mccartyi TaxID=61435 RepID=A0A2J1E0D5_9CHLR|nr:hypothetical protein CVH13_00158 [Dehalococcoides mccartyi]